MAEKLTESDHVGQFMVELYHNGHFRYDELIPKRIVRQEFANYLKKNNLSDHPEFKDKVGTILRKNDYLLHTDKDCNQFKIKSKTFAIFYANFIRKMDEQQIKYSSITAMIMPENDCLSTTENRENPSSSSFGVNLNDDEISVLYQGGTKIEMSDDDKSLPITNMGCFICQKNFLNDEDYENHIEYHGEGSRFKSAQYYSKSNKNPDIKLSYRTCKNSYLLYFTMKTNQEDIIIKKIIIVRSRWMDYIRDDEVPFEMCKESTFMVDRHSFHLGRPQPIVLIYAYKNQSSARNIAQYLFMRNEEFPNVKMKLKSTRVISKDEMKKTGKLDSYYPSDKFRKLYRDNDNIDCDALVEMFPKMKDYLHYTKELTANTIIDVFRILLHIEDIEICNKYKKLSRINCKIDGHCNEYSVGIKNLKPDTTIGEILKPFDEIVLTSCDDNDGNEDNDDNDRHNNNNKRKKKFVCYVYRTNNTQVFFTPRDKNKKIPSNKLYNIKFSPGRIPIIYQFRALEILNQCHDIRHNFLFPTKNFNNDINMQQNRYLHLDFYNNKIKINPEQEQAVINIVDGSFKSIPYIIFGPPGTGKTTTVVESIYQLWKNDKNSRILVTAGSNAACDEVALKLCNIFNDVDAEGLNLLRIYAAAVEKRIDNMDENLIEASNLCHNSHFYPSIESICMYRIIIATLTVCGKLVQGKIGDKFFTHVFIDECAASTEPETLVGIAGIVSSNTKLILSGDPKQLGPILESNQASEWGLSLSLIERLMKRSCYSIDPITGDYDRTIQTRLIRNFRTHEKILLLSNSLYYDSTLIPCAKQEITDWSLGWHRLPCKNFPILFNVVFGRTERANDSKSLCNYKELSVTLDYVKNLLFFGIKGRKITENDIGIISPYKKQCNLIRDELDKRKWYRIETGSVEIFQGKEKPIIIISMVRSDTPNVGFLNNPRRTNVALTRAQTLLIIIGNPETLEKIDDWRQVIEYCKDNNALAGAKYPRPMLSTNFKLSQSNLSDVTSVSKNSNVRQDIVEKHTTKKNYNGRRTSHKRNNKNNQNRSTAIIRTEQDKSDTISLGSNFETRVSAWLENNGQFRKEKENEIKKNTFENNNISEQKNTNNLEIIHDDEDNISKSKMNSFEIIELDGDNKQPLPNVSGHRINPFEIIHDIKSNTEAKNAFRKNVNSKSSIIDIDTSDLAYLDKDTNTQPLPNISRHRINPFEIIHDNNSTTKDAFQKHINLIDYDCDLIDLDTENSFQLSKVTEQKSSPFEIIHDDIQSKAAVLPKNVISKTDYLTQDLSTIVPVSKVDYNNKNNDIVDITKLNESASFTLMKDINSKNIFVDKNEKEPLKVINNHRLTEEIRFDIRPHRVTLPEQPIRSTTMIHPFEKTIPIHTGIIEENDPELVEQSENILRSKVSSFISSATTPSPKKKDKCIIS